MSALMFGAKQRTGVRPGGGFAGKVVRGVRRISGAVGGVRVRRRRRRRARGISGSELRGFRKVSRLLASVGMRGRGLGPMRRGGRRPFR